MRLRLLIIAMLALLAVPGGRTRVPTPGHDLRGSRRAVRRRPARHDARRDQGLRGHADPPARVLAAVRAVPTRKTKPSFNASNPDAYPPGTGRLDRLVAAAEARGIKVMLDADRPGAAVGDEGQEGLREPAHPKWFGQFVTALARRYGDQVATWSVWNEPNQPQFLMPQYRKKKPYSPTLYRALYRAAYSAIRSVRVQPAGQDPDRRDVAARQRPHRASAAFPARDGVPERQYKKTRSCSRLPADGYAHHAYTTRSARGSCRRTRTT